GRAAAPARRSLHDRLRAARAHARGGLAWIARRSRGMTLIALETGGPRPPFFFVHPITGLTSPYPPIAREFRGERPVYALAAAGLDGECAPRATIEEMAGDYIAEIRTVWPDGPYLLVGWSFGGVIAYQMARELEQRGVAVARLVILD